MKGCVRGLYSFLKFSNDAVVVFGDRLRLNTGEQIYDTRLITLAFHPTPTRPRMRNFNLFDQQSSVALEVLR